MTRKRFVKLMQAASARCHAINKASGHLSYKPGKCNLRHYQLPEGKTYADVWAVMEKALDGIVTVGK